MAHDSETDEDSSDILGQDDIDSLLQQVSTEASEPIADTASAAPSGSAAGDFSIEGAHVIDANGRRFSAEKQPLIEPYDFSNPSFLGETEMRRLRLLHEDFIKMLEARFTLFLGCDFSLNMTQLSTKNYDQAVQDVENPSHIALFRANHMPGVGFIEMSPNLALTIASSIIGGKGHAARIERYLTQIEVDLIEEFLIVLLEEWCGQWVTDGEVEPQIIGHEIVASVMQICEHDAVMFSLVMDASIRGSNGKITICVPLLMIEDAIKQMKERQGYELKSSEQAAAPSWRNGYEQIPVKGLVELSMGHVDVQVAKDWKVGTVLPLAHDAMQSAILKLAGKALFTCEVGIEDDYRAIKIHHKVEKEKDLWPTIQ